MPAIELISKDDLEQFKSELFAELRRMGIRSQGPAIQNKEWIKSYEVRKLLNISPGTLQNLRINGTLHYTKIGGILYYKTEDINKLLENNLR
jgi:hypothetical protein